MGRLRIIAGELRGRKIRVAEHPGLRPTPDRVREALFSILADRIPGARVLDLYCGSGAMAFEALSRGAREALLVDNAPPVLRELRATIAALKLSRRCRVIEGEVTGLLAKGAIPGNFRLIFADPPYHGGERQGLVERVSGLLESGGILVVERELDSAADEPARGSLQRTRTVTYGRTCLDFYRSSVPG